MHSFPRHLTLGFVAEVRTTLRIKGDGSPESPDRPAAIKLSISCPLFIIIHSVLASLIFQRESQNSADAAVDGYFLTDINPLWQLTRYRD